MREFLARPIAADRLRGGSQPPIGAPGAVRRI
jgi:hypothetical protein